MPCSRIDSGQLGERRGVHLRARLVLAGRMPVDRDRLQRVAGRRGLVGAGEQRVEAAPQSFRSNHRRLLDA